MKSSTNNVLFLLGILAVAFIGYMIFKPKDQNQSRGGSNGNNSTPQNHPSNNTSVPVIATRVSKNESNTLSLISYNVATNEITNSRVLDFNEAIKLVGGAANVCLAPPNGKFGANGYKECSVIRISR